MQTEAADDHKIAPIGRALGHPARLKILRLLARSPGRIGAEIVEVLGLSQSTVSEHLRILKSAGLVSGNVDPPRCCYNLAPTALASLVDFITELETSVAQRD